MFAVVRLPLVPTFKRLHAWVGIIKNNLLIYLHLGQWLQLAQLAEQSPLTLEVRS